MGRDTHRNTKFEFGFAVRIPSRQSTSNGLQRSPLAAPRPQLRSRGGRLISFALEGPLPSLSICASPADRLNQSSEVFTFLLPSFILPYFPVKRCLADPQQPGRCALVAPHLLQRLLYASFF